jgi:cytochrome c oxidase subunit 1
VTSAAPEWFTTSPPPLNNFDPIPRIGSVAMKDIRQEVHARVKASGTVAQPTAPGV